MVVQKKYEFMRIKDNLEQEGLMIVISNIRELTLDTKTGKLINLSSRYSHSCEFPIENIPNKIQRIPEIKPTEISPEEFANLVKLYENDINSFLLYTPIY